MMLGATMMAWAQEHPNIGAITWNANGYYEIGSEVALEDLAVYVNGSGTYSAGCDETTPHNCADLTFKLTTDITLTGSHTPIGTATMDLSYYSANPATQGIPFSGHFNGCSHTITGLTINQPTTDFLGLFGLVTGGATIENLTLDNLNITGADAIGGIVGCTQGLASEAKVTIQNCRVNGTISALLYDTSVTAHWHGGIVGCAFDYTDITNCVVTGAINYSDPNSIGEFYFHYFGGICGLTRKHINISTCTNMADVNAYGIIGGIVGFDSEADYDEIGRSNSFSNCFNVGNIQADATSYQGKECGNIIGTAYPYRYYDYDNYCLNVTNCYYYTTGSVKAFGDNDNSYDYSGRGERVYKITKGDNISAITIAEEPTYTSTFTGFSYYKYVNQANAWTLTLTPNWTSAYFERFTASNGTLTNPTIFDGTHQLYYFNQDVVIDADILSNIGAMTWNNTDQCFEIASKEALEDLAVYVNGKGTYSNDVVETAKHDCLGMTFKLAQDITMTGEQNPIGALLNNSYSLSDSQFRGHFDGAGHSITNLTINHPNDNYQGLFGYAMSSRTITSYLSASSPMICSSSPVRQIHAGLLGLE